MSLQEALNQDLKNAMKEKNELLVLVLRTIKSEIHNKEIEKKKELTEEEILQVISNEAKKRKDAIEGFTKGNRNDLVEKEQKELEILKKYLPKQMNEDQIKEIAQKTVEEINAIGPQDTGKVMASLMPKLKGKADGKIVSKIVNELLRS